MKRISFALYGQVILTLGILLNAFGILINIPRRLFLSSFFSFDLNKDIIWYSGFPIVLGLILISLDLFINVNKLRKKKNVLFKSVENELVTVVLTAYNDELSIGNSVKDFLNHPRVKRVIVISNNSTDRTLEVAQRAGAVAFNEKKQGYGACVYRALSEGVTFDDTSLTVLCEGDMTFRAIDIDKLLAYIPHADIVVGTRIVEQLQDSGTQITIFVHYGNFFVGKLLEMKHFGMVSLTDVGTTYKICRNEILKKLLPKLDPSVNLEFNPYFLDKALSEGARTVECPITFYKRVGKSKGGNASNFIAYKLGMRMIYGILFNWKGIAEDV